MHDAAATVSVADLRKRYGATEAVSGISFNVGAGEVFGLLGPNGAGKTTTLECVLGLREPDAGSIHINGIDARRHPAQAKLQVGAQLQAATLQDKITPRQALELFGSFYAKPLSAGELLERFDLQTKADAAFETLSGGQRQRLFLALALVNRPSVLVLDEPTVGLDPQARREVRRLIREMQKEGATVLLSTHDLEEASQLCDRVAILDGRRIVANAPPAELIARVASPARVVIRTAPTLTADAIDSLPEARNAVSSGDGWVVETHAPNRLLADLVRRADQVGAELLQVELLRPSLEDAFFEITGRPWSGEGEPGEMP